MTSTASKRFQYLSGMSRDGISQGTSLQKLLCLLLTRCTSRYEHNADGILSFIAHFNACSLWISSCIVACEDLNQRILRLEYFIRTASALRAHNNFSGLKSLLFGIRGELVSQLTHTWERVDPELMASLQVRPHVRCILFMCYLPIGIGAFVQ